MIVKVIAEYLKSLALNDYTISDTLIFPSLYKNQPLDNNEVYVSYYVDSLFTSIPLIEARDFILEEMFGHNKIQPFFEKSAWRKLLQNYANAVYSANGNLFRQIDSYQ